MRVLVCGGRDYEDGKKVFDVLDEIACVSGQYPLGEHRLTIIHGAARGADALADQWAVSNWQECEAYPADWDAYGKRAGGIRNQLMLDEGKPDIVVAFPGGAGTRDMVRRAEKAGVEVRLVQ